MPVKLISYTKTADESQSLLDVIAYCARVSNPANQNNTQTNEKLVRYLIKNNHWSPLEMVNVCLEIETTRDIARQILRHRSFSFQEFSQRYAVADLGFECKEARLQDKKNRQNSIKTNNTDLEQEWTKQQNSLAEHAQTAYTWALENGIAKEQARAVLPEGMTTTKMYMNGTLRSWVHYISLRHANGTQKEHSDIAIECAKAIQPIFPMISEFVSTISISDVDKKYESLIEM
jgi:thymidylate synthase (FAD)